MELHAKKFIKIAKRLFPEVRDILEIGANDGKETLYFSKNLEGVFAFECNPESLKLLRKRVKGISNVVIFPFAAGDKRGFINFFSVKGRKHGSSSVFKVNPDNVKDIKTQNRMIVPCERPDFWIGYSTDLIWLDCQGSELSALKGFNDFIDGVKLIHTEVEFTEMYLGQPLFKDVHKYLKSKGFSILTFTTLGKHACDVIYVNNRFKTTFIPDFLKIIYFRTLEKLIGKYRVWTK